MGQPKQLMRFRGETLVRRSARVAIEAGLGPVIVVVGAEMDRIQSEVASLPVEVVHNHRWSDGMGSSIAAGVERVKQNGSGVLITLVDQPLVDASLLRKLARLLSEFDAAACRYGQSVGVPAAFGARLLDRLRTLPPSAGAKAVLSDPAVRVAELTFEGGTFDIDTPEDYQALATLPGSANDKVTERIP